VIIPPAFPVVRKRVLAPSVPPICSVSRFEIRRILLVPPFPRVPSKNVVIVLRNSVPIPVYVTFVVGRLLKWHPALGSPKSFPPSIGSTKKDLPTSPFPLLCQANLVEMMTCFSLHFFPFRRFYSGQLLGVRLTDFPFPSCYPFSFSYFPLSLDVFPTVAHSAMINLAPSFSSSSGLLSLSPLLVLQASSHPSTPGAPHELMVQHSVSPPDKYL